MIPSFVPGPGCTVDDAGIEVRGEGPRVSVAVELTVRSDGACRTVAFALPAGAVAGAIDAAERRYDGTRVSLDATRWVTTDRAPDGDATTTLLVPDLWSRDRVRVALVRDQVPADVAAAWLAGQGAPDAPPADPPTITHHARTLTLVVPAGDPLLHLHPDGAATSRIDDVLTVAPADTARALVPALPPGVAPALRSEPAGAATLAPLGGVWQVALAPSEGPTKLHLSWTDPASPTHGERGGLDVLAVQVDDGVVTWEADRWALRRVRDRDVLPDRDALVRGLDRRFRAAAIPEPSAPGTLRGLPADDALLAELRPVITARTPVLPAGGDPLFVRPLVKARKRGAFTPTEAALVTWLAARQLRFDATWALVRPAPSETLPADAPDPASPAGYVAPLVVVETEQGDRWIDPACGSCAPFELPPWLEGARALSPSGRVRTPDPTPGSLRVVVGPDEVTLDAAGPPALLLRLSLRDVPAAARADALAAAVAGPGARLRALEGLDVAGAPLHLVAARGDGPVPDPTALPAPGRDGAWWFDWVGPRTLVAPGDAAARTVTLPGLTDAVTVTDGVTTHVLDVRERRVPADLAAFAPPPVEAVSPLPPDPAPPSPTSGSSSP